MKLKRIFQCVVVLAAVLCLFMPKVALAEPTADVRVAITPVRGDNDDMILEINLTIANGMGSDSITSLEFTYNNRTVAYCATVAGNSDVFLRSNPLGISYTQTVGDFPITLYYVDFDGVPRETTVTVTNTYVEPVITIKPAYTYGTQPGTVVLSYTVRNEGTLDVTDLVLTEELSGVGEIGRIASLVRGASQTLTKEVTLSGSATARASASYQAAGGSRTFSTRGEALEIKEKNARITVSLKADLTSVLAEEKVTLTCSLSNEGNVAFTDVVLSEETLGEMGTGISLDVGKLYSTTKIVKPTQTVSYVFTATAKDADGQSYSFSSTPVTVQVTPTQGTAKVSKLELEVSTDSTTLTQPGDVVFNCLIRNSGETTLEQVALSDGKGNIFNRANSFAPGDQIFPVQIAVNESGRFTFVVEGLTPEGNTISATSAPIDIQVGTQAVVLPTDGTQPGETPVPTVTTGTTGLSPWLLVLYIFLVLLILACIVVLVIIQIRNRRRQRREEDDAFVYTGRTEQEPYTTGEEFTYTPSEEDTRAEISRFAEQYSPKRENPPLPGAVRPQAPPRTPYAPPRAYDQEQPTVYKKRPAYDDEQPTIYKGGPSPRRRTDPPTKENRRK